MSRDLLDIIDPMGDAAEIGGWAEYDAQDPEREAALTEPHDGEPQDTSVFEAEWPETEPMDDGLAEWCVDKLASCDERIARIKAQAEAMIKDVESDREGLLFQNGERLRDWTRRKLAGNRRKNARSHKLLVGTVGFRTVPGRVIIVNPITALDYCRQWLPEAIREVVDTKKIHVVPVVNEETGEIAYTCGEGCEWISEREVFYVKGVKVKDAAGVSDE